MNVLEELKSFYDNFEYEKGYMGFTESGEPIPYFKVEKSVYPVVISQYAIHAREYVTTYLCLEHIKDFIKNGRGGVVFFIPAVNIDGIKIVLSGKKLYKANKNSVDLNVNFDAKFGQGLKNVNYPSDENYTGKYPFSESETKALRDFTLFVRPDITLSFHSKGEELYWDFFQDGESKKRDYFIAKKLSECTGYRLAEAVGSCGGYKDWCIEKLKIPSYTFEVGNDVLTHPIGKESVPEIFSKTKNVFNTLFTVFTEKPWK